MLKARQTSYGAFVALYILVVLAVVVVANWLADHHNKTVDVTANKQFTLSDQTKKVTGNLKKDVTIYYFDQSDSYDRARDMLDRYKNLSSKIKVDYVDPDKKPDVARVEGARAIGRHHCRQRREEGNRQRPHGRRTDRRAGPRPRRAARAWPASSTVPASTRSADTGREGYSTLKDALEKNNYKTETISLIEKPEIPKTCNIVVVGGPKHDYLQPAIDALKNLCHGRRPCDLQLRSGAESA